MNGDLLALASAYRDALPSRIRGYLNARGISNEAIDTHLLGYGGGRLTIPIFDRLGTVAFFKLAKDPEDKSASPKMLSSPGASAQLYGWERVRAKPCRIIVCEGEFDRLVLESRGFAAVTSTAGAGTFRKEWAEALSEIPEVLVCFDRDEAGRAGALRVARMIPQARIVELPEETGDAGDVTDFFVRLQRSTEELLTLLDRAEPPPPDVSPPAPEPAAPHAAPALKDRARIERLKALVPIAEVIGQYVALRPAGANWRGLCPFHEDREPSLVVYPASATFHCFGCQKHGDAIDFLKDAAGLSFHQALRALELLSQHERTHKADR